MPPPRCPAQQVTLHSRVEGTGAGSRAPPRHVSKSAGSAAGAGPPHGLHPLPPEGSAQPVTVGGRSVPAVSPEPRTWRARVFTFSIILAGVNVKVPPQTWRVHNTRTPAGRQRPPSNAAPKPKQAMRHSLPPAWHARAQCTCAAPTGTGPVPVPVPVRAPVLVYARSQAAYAGALHARGRTNRVCVVRAAGHGHATEDVGSPVDPCTLWQVWNVHLL